MKKASIIVVVLVSFSFISCTYLTKKPVDIDDKLLNELSQDLAEIHMMVDSANSALSDDSDKMNAAIVKKWNTAGLYRTFFLPVESGRAEQSFDFINSRSIISVKNEKGNSVKAEILRLGSPNNNVYAVAKSFFEGPMAIGDVPPKSPDEIYHSHNLDTSIDSNSYLLPKYALAKSIPVGGLKLNIYDPDLALDSVTIGAVSDYIFSSRKVDKYMKEILERLEYMKKKYEASPIYFDGFSIQFPPISIKFDFKLKR
jgi:hypothetical protein